ncbi:MAG: sulfite exporter TauE/SafE family protein [Gammaproteobacteria bacterium]|nr:sulfite exporter TauE/SafE family protein [Gammaproteobacteria bacterium]
MIVSFLAGAVGSMGGPGGLIITPFLIATGLPPATAVGTTKLSAIGMWIITLMKFHAADQIRWHRVPAMMLISLIGGVIGAYLMVSMSDQTAYPVVGVLLLLIAPLALWKPSLGLTEIETTSAQRTLGYILYFLITVFGGFFGGGTGVLIIIALCWCWGWTALQAHASDIPGWLLMLVVTSVIFVVHDRVVYSFAVYMFVGLALGGYVGSHLAIRGGSRLVRNIAVGFAALVGAKLLVQAFS